MKPPEALLDSVTTCAVAPAWRSALSPSTTDVPEATISGGIRLRALTDVERASGCKVAWVADGKQRVHAPGVKMATSAAESMRSAREYTFTSDRVYGPDMSTEASYEESLSARVAHAPPARR